MRILVVGGGGREHALAWRLAAGAEVVFVAPGNAGIASVAECVPISSDDSPSLVTFALEQSIGLVVVGPEAPLVAGLADELEAAGVAVFGPRSAGARLEGSKTWARDLCDRYDIAQPWSRSFTDIDEAMAFVHSYEGPYVVKADGLAAGKGVTVTPDLAVAEAALVACLSDGVFGDAGSRVLVEECMTGPEISALALTDGHSILPLALAQDHKRVGDGDSGPNTGGMGAYSPVPFVDDALREQITSGVLVPTVRALEAEGIDYRGVIYAGLMLTEEGPKVLEFNCRFGDPETQALMPRIAEGLPEALMACARGGLDADIRWLPGSCLTVTLASGGYPGAHRTGFPIEGLDEAAEIEGVTVFHSGTTMRDDRVVTSGGRVLSVSAVADTLEEARAKAYEACSRISFEGMHYRTDIAAMGVSID